MAKHAKHSKRSARNWRRWGILASAACVVLLAIVCVPFALNGGFPDAVTSVLESDEPVVSDTLGDELVEDLAPDDDMIAGEGETDGAPYDEEGLPLEGAPVEPGEEPQGAIGASGAVVVPEEVLVEHTPDYSGLDYEPGELLVQPVNEASSADVLAVLADYGISAYVVEENELFTQVALDDGADVARAAAALDLSGTVEYAEPNLILTTQDDLPLEAQEGEVTPDAPEGDADAGAGEAAADELANAAEPSDEPAADASAEGTADVPAGDAAVDASDVAGDEAAADGASDAEASANAENELDAEAATDGADSETDADTEEADGEDSDEDEEDADEKDKLETQAATNDSKLSEQWALESMNVIKAWDIVKGGSVSKKVTVAVIDEGFDVSHPDLKANIVNPWNPISGTSDVSETAGQGSHGTHVAGIVAAVAGNNLGVAGVTYNAQVMPIKVYATGATSVTTSNVAKALDYVVSVKDKYNVRVANISLGTLYDAAPPSAWNDTLTQAIDRATAAGIVVVGCAGNSSSTAVPPYTCYPSDYAPVVSVVNIGKDLLPDKTSNYNAPGTMYKDVSAPGVGILSTVADGKYETKTGTSMASPQVAGVLALMFSKYPNLTVEQATSRLLSTATDLNKAENLSGTTYDYKTAYGEVNAYEALKSDPLYFTSYAATLQKGASSTFKASKGGLSWASSNTKVATVSNGIVKAVGGGTAVITGTSSSAFDTPASQVVTVYDPVLSGASQVFAGKTASLKLACTVSGAWKYTSSNTAVASVSSTGVVSGKKAGKVTITATLATNSAIKASTSIEVLPALPTRAQLGATRVPVGATTQLNVPAGYTLKVESGSTAYGKVSAKNVFTGVKANSNVKLGLYKGSQRLATYSMAVYALSGAYFVQSAMNANWVLDISGNSTSNGGNMIIYKRNSGNNQKFRFAYSGGYYTLTCVKSGKLVDVSGGSLKDGGNVLQWVANKGKNQQWSVTVDASNRLTFVNRNSGKPLDVAGGKAANSANVRQWKSTGGNGQKWSLAAASVDAGYVLPEGTFRIGASSKTSMSLNVKSSSKKNSANVVLLSSNGKTSQQFKLVYYKNGLYRLQAVHSGRSLCVKGGKWKNKTNVYQYASANNDRELWKPVRNSDGTYTFYRNGNTKWALTYASTKKNANVYQGQVKGKPSASQKFRLYQY